MAVDRVLVLVLVNSKKGGNYETREKTGKPYEAEKTEDFLTTENAEDAEGRWFSQPLRWSARRSRRKIVER